MFPISRVCRGRLSLHETFCFPGGRLLLRGPGHSPVVRAPKMQGAICRVSLSFPQALWAQGMHRTRCFYFSKRFLFGRFFRFQQDRLLELQFDMCDVGKKLTTLLKLPRCHQNSDFQFPILLNRLQETLQAYSVLLSPFKQQAIPAMCS